MRSTRNNLKGVTRVDAPPRFTDRVRKTIDRQEERLWIEY